MVRHVRNGGIFLLDEKIKAVIDIYPVQVTGVSRGRGGWICQTNNGPVLLKLYPYGENHLIYESMLKYVIEDRGFRQVDNFLYNKEGQILTTAADGKKYVMKRWFDGRECDLKNTFQVNEAVRTLALLHKAMSHIHFECPWMVHAKGTPTDQLFSKRIKELRHIRSYMQGKRGSHPFETLFLKWFEPFYDQAICAEKILKDIDYKTMYASAIEDGVFCHGDYSHHHVMIYKSTTAVINFDKAVMNIQVCDLYYFLRKAMEKWGWNVEKGKNIIDVYQQYKALTPMEKQLLYALLLFPEKYWKVANRYYNGRKCWTSAVNMEKLEKCTDQWQLRQAFMDSYFLS